MNRPTRHRVNECIVLTELPAERFTAAEWREGASDLAAEVRALREELDETNRSRGITELVELFTEMREAASRLLAQIDVTDDAEAFDEAIAAMRAVLARLPPNG